MKSWRARDWSANPELECIRKWCPGVVELECPSVVCADPRRVYPEVESECNAVCVRVSRAGSLVNAGLDLNPDGACISLVRVSASQR